MSKTSNKFSVKSSMYPKGRERAVDGPWKPPVEEAVKAYAEMLVRKELATFLVCRPFVAEKFGDENTAPAKDVRGVCYKTNTEATEVVKTRLAQLGLHV